MTNKLKQIILFTILYFIWFMFLPLYPFNALIKCKNFFFEASFLNVTQNSEGVFVSINETLGRVNNVYLVFNESECINNCNVSVKMNRSTMFYVILILNALMLSLMMFIIILDESENILMTKIINKESNCPICLEDDCNISINFCKHEFHDLCINEWFKFRKSCPLCQYELE